MGMCQKIKTLKTPQQAFLASFPTGLTPPTFRSLRLALVHTGNENGFLPYAAELIFLRKKNAADIHDEMDGEIYEQYFKDQVLQNLPPNSVIVLDNASYHSRKIESIPTPSWRKAKIQEWMISHNTFYHN
jgi:hypothetical protein